MALHRKKLGLLISSLPDSPQFWHGIRLAEVALAEGVDVYLYCIDDAVTGVGEEKVQNLKSKGLKLYACAYGAHRRNFPLSDQATFAGLTVVSDLIAGTNRFLSFN